MAQLWGAKDTTGKELDRIFFAVSAFERAMASGREERTRNEKHSNAKLAKDAKESGEPENRDCRACVACVACLPR